MLNALSRLFARTAPIEQTKLQEVDSYEEEIPRYPPFAKGLPVAPVDKVVATQDELVERIRNALGFNREQHNELILPVIQRYAEFVHLLPASEAHHHRGAGGLFRHGLEVAFWAAQASEAVIFSMEGSPRERRNNEPRWRLASCFSGLLHDVGKPLSDVSVTDKDGSVTWNPYANTLYGWATHHKVERYFLRWRDNRHKRHEQFSLLTIERIIPPNVLQFLSEAGPEILEAMLEAIAGTSTNQPVTRLMLKADQESVSRDLKQSRLDVDEFSYGVPVERYVFDAIRRLVKTGKWKVNEPGARVWHVHQGVFITWRQLGDLYEMITKDKIPGIPRDPDTLADILIERGFAIPNAVSGSNGESAHYRYWEVCPEMLQEGRPPGSVKLLGLRLESHELVFTTEPPAPVKAVIVGEREEPAIEFEDIDDSSAGTGGVDTEDEQADVANSAGNDDGADPAEPSRDLADAYDLVASVPEIGAGGAAPLDGLMTGDGVDFPFEAFGMEQPAEEPLPESAPDQSDHAAVTEPLDCAEETPPAPHEGKSDGCELVSAPAPEASPLAGVASAQPTTAVADQSNMFGGAASRELDISSLFPGQKKKGKKKGALAEVGHRDAALSEDVPHRSPVGEPSPLSKQPSEPKPLEAKGVNPPAPVAATSGSDKPSARDKLATRLKALTPESESLLSKAIFPVLDGEALLGEVLCLFQGQAAILYPEGADSIGDSSNVLARLWDDGLIAGDPVLPSRKIQTFKGLKGLVLAPEISGLVTDALNEAEGSREGLQSMFEREPQRSKKNAPKKPEKTKVATTNRPAQNKGDRGAPEPPRRRPEKAASQEPDKVGDKEPKQNSTRARPPEQVVAEPKTNLKVGAKKMVVIPEIEESDLLPKGKGRMTADFDDIKPEQITPKAAIELLKQMMIKREGKWIVSAVSRRVTFWSPVPSHLI
ncbi:MobH family relaxase [Marinobacterium aestuariivivens]|uniref:MobH family relaxase n=1 Tax=Marinobacterium aestuariivivens TaxID=1698799 RepID=A0ABW2A9K7_9GAMM